MIKVATEDGRTFANLDGTLKELTSDALCILKGIYTAIRNDNRPAAEIFKRVYIDGLELVWEDNDEDQEDGNDD